MTRADLARAIYQRHGGMTQQEAAELVDRIISKVSTSVVRDGTVTIKCFGSLKVFKRRSRKGINPRTGRTMMIRGRRTVVFRPSRVLIVRINSPS